ncbi:MAG: cellulase family glycosylhydrolase [Myxococcales bacterium]
MPHRTWLTLAVTVLALGACPESKAPVAPPVSALKTDRSYLRDSQGRYVQIHGVNVGGTSKVPASVSASGLPSFVGRPFPIEDADEHFARLQAAGFDSIRLVLQWEGIEPLARGQYDEAYLDYVQKLVQAAGQRRLRVLLDMHQDLFSRLLAVKFNNHPRGKAGDIESMLFAFLPPYNDTIQGDGAPKWVVQGCLPEKKLDSPNWGTPRVLSGLDEEALLAIYNLFQKLTSGGPAATSGSIPWIVDFLLQKPDPFGPEETSDLLPLTNGSAALSLDVARAFACFFAGDKAFPGLMAEGRNVKDWAQDAYAEAFAQVAQRVADEPNVMGYDLMNEPSSNFVVLAAYGAMATGGLEGVRSTLNAMLGPETGPLAFDVLAAFRVLPPDLAPSTLKAWGLDRIDPTFLLSLNNGFEDDHLRPFYERVGRRILQEDPDAIFFVENTLGLNAFLGQSGGIAGTFEKPMTRPDLPQVVYAPHYYADIYPFPGINQPPRKMTATEVRYRDYQAPMEKAASLSRYSMGNPPTLFGEFGTFFTFNGIYQARQEEYLTSACILNDYYEAMERMGMGGMLWCYSAGNTFEKGDQWNHEDFSILDQDENLRAAQAWARPHARALAGKPLSSHFYSDLHYFDPDKGVVPPVREFEVRYASKETVAPSEIAIPDQQYPEGFYVWLSDGHCVFDPATRTLMHYPSDDAPETVHTLKILPPLEGRVNEGWRYFFKGDKVLTRD